ncbi:hypothetical protein BLA29_009290 [Euroglyphus maynei]|uniref:Uncharacterized protein n=1 Tax=Euroglyphus maynei TaxID=6958 RepID=A0A1Y3BSR5_EURMA|nr:hypothetical protein BLA29_009290 [Euroglyphus maynei]
MFPSQDVEPILDINGDYVRQESEPTPITYESNEDDDDNVEIDRNLNSTDSHDKTELQKYFDSYLIIACNSPFLFVYLISLTKYFHRITNDLKICLSFFTTIMTFVIITSFVKINTDECNYLMLFL